MGWSINTNHKDHWEVFSSISESVIATFVTERELKKWLAEEEVYKGKLKAIETLMIFPSEWTINDEYKIIPGNLSNYHRWCETLDYTNRENRLRQIDEKLEELMK